MGDGVSVPSASYSRTMRSQSVSSTDGATAWHSAMEAWRPYAPSPRPTAPAATRAARPRRMAARSQRRRSWSSSSTGVPSARDPRREPGGGELEEREQSLRVGLVRHEPREHPREPDRLAGEVGADPVAARGGARALGEDQVDHAQHRAQPLAALVGRRQLERHLRGGERLLRAGDPGLDGRGGGDEGPRDLVAGQAAEHAQGERDAGLARQHRVAGDEHEGEDVVVDPLGVVEHVVLLSGVGRGARGGLAVVQVGRHRGVPLVERRPPPVRVDRAAPPDGEQPAGGVVGYAVARPRDERLGQRLLREVLGHREVAGVAGEPTDDARGLDPPHGLDRLAALAGASRRSGRCRRRVGHSWPVDSRHAFSFWIHSLSCGNSSMFVTRRISVFDAGPGQRRPLGPLDGLLLGGDVEDPEAVEQLLGLAVRPVGDDRRLRGVVDDDAVLRVVEPLRGDQHAGLDQLVVELAHRVQDLVEVDVLERVPRLVGGPHDQHVLHRLAPLVPGSLWTLSSIGRTAERRIDRFLRRSSSRFDGRAPARWSSEVATAVLLGG